jgi:SAM-dependent methyltransferase
VVAAPGGPGANARTAVDWEVLSAVLAEARAEPGRGDVPLEVVDAGGGTGGFAVPLAEAGCSVTVVDPSPDSLAALERRAAEAGVRTVRGAQGSLDDIAGLVAIAGPAGYDVVLCHHVLEVVDDPRAAVAAIARVLRPGGVASILTANRAGAVWSRALAGRFDDAQRLVADPDGRFGEGDALARRFDRPGLVGLLTEAGLRVDVVHGARVFADLLPGAVLDDPATVDALVALETVVAELPAYGDVAADLHVLAGRP